MLTIPSSVRIWLATELVDMRRGFDGLSTIVRDVWSVDPHSGHLFVFVGKRRDRVKILFWDRGGFCLYYKRLEKGRLQAVEAASTSGRVQMDSTQLTMLLSGFDLNVARLKPWKPNEGIDTSGQV
jgi:transposase